MLDSVYIYLLYLYMHVVSCEKRNQCINLTNTKKKVRMYSWIPQAKRCGEDFF